jgi:glucosyl-dolichyl phosphate glucuronosyltransferase
MKISVIIVTFNRAASLKEALQSLSKQTCYPDEVIVVDNNSNDDTKEVVRRFEGALNIRYVFEEKRGIPFARNAGIEKAQYEIVAFMDDDCRPAHNWLEELVKPFYRDPLIGQVGGEILPHDKPRSIIEEFCNDDAMMRVNAEYDLDLKIG